MNMNFKRKLPIPKEIKEKLEALGLGFKKD